MDDLQEVIPDDELRTKMVAEDPSTRIRISSPNLFLYSMVGLTRPVFTSYLVSHIKEQPFRRGNRGWPTYELEAGHFHMLVDAEAV